MTISASYTLGTGVVQLTDTPTGGNALPLTDPSILGNRPPAAYLQATTQDIRFTSDGSLPTSSVGTLLVAGAAPFFYSGGPINQLKFIRVTAGAVLNVLYSMTETAQGPQGITGSQGAQGNTGGAQGATGAQGAAGSAGAQGAAGAAGAQGVQGPAVTLPALAALAVYPNTVSSPLDIDDCVLWLDASDATTINAGSPVDDDPVSNWADKSASNLDAVQATAENKPVYKTAIQNGLAAIRFDPADTIVDPQYFGLTGAALAILKNKPGVTVAFTGAPYADTDAPVIWLSSGTATTRDRCQILMGEENYVGASNNDAVDSSSAGVNMHCNANGDFDFRERPRSVVIRAQLADQFNIEGVTNFTPDGVQNSFDIPGGTPGNFPNTNSLFFLVGAFIDGLEVINGAKMDLYELVIFDRCLTSIEQGQLFQYLSAKWGLFV